MDSEWIVAGASRKAKQANRQFNRSPPTQTNGTGNFNRQVKKPSPYLVRSSNKPPISQVPSTVNKLAPIIIEPNMVNQEIEKDIFEDVEPNITCSTTTLSPRIISPMTSPRLVQTLITPETVIEVPNVPVIPITPLGSSSGPITKDIQLHCPYVLWIHDIVSKDWSLSSYHNVCTITTVREFWQMYNGMKLLGIKSNNFFLMKQGIEPLWEHESNRDGGTCSFRTDIILGLTVFENICTRLLCNSLLNETFKSNHDDLNGISFCPKNNWVIVKVWNKNKANDLSKTLSPWILNTYKSMSIRYKQNEPEY
jgi:hypothetical protein